MTSPERASDYDIRISPEAFVVALALFLGIAFVFAVLRTVIRLQQNRRLYADDYLLFYAVAAAAACAGVAYSIKDQVYLQIYVGLGWQQPAADFYDVMLVFEKRIMVCSALIWSIIYAIKFSFLAFFRKLVDRVFKLEVYWWIVVVITALCGLTSIPLSFIICAHFGNDYMTYCPIESQLANERIYMHTTTGLDIFTDVLIISIPILLLWNVHISLTRKITLCFMLCLSAFCIVIAIIRTSLADLPVNGVIDTSWLVFWQGIEAAIAVIIVSCTALRGLFGTEGAFTKRRAAKKARLGGGKIPGSDGMTDGSAHSSSTGPSNKEKNSKHQQLKSWYKYGGGRDSGLDTMLDELPTTWEPAMARPGSGLEMRPKETKKEVTFNETERRSDSDEDLEAQRSRRTSEEVKKELASERNRQRRSDEDEDRGQKKFGYTARISAS